MIVVGGRQRAGAIDLDEWHAYEAALIVIVDPESNRMEVMVEYVSPPEVCAADQPSIVFKAGQRRGDRLLVCTQTELIEFNCRTWQRTRYLTHPWFNDVHHVCYGDDHCWMVADTGLDLVLKVDLNGQVVDSWNVGETPTWDRFDRDVDYRLVATTKPHEAHHNYVCQVGGEWWATRYQYQDAVRIDDLTQRMLIPPGHPHDGQVIDGGDLVFTTTNGHVVRMNASSLQQAECFDLNVNSHPANQLGWCRGISFDQPHFAWVGFSRLRPAWVRKYLSWIKQGFQHRGTYGTQPTRIALYDLSGPTLVREINLESIGMNAVFDICPLYDKS